MHQKIFTERKWNTQTSICPGYLFSQRVPISQWSSFFLSIWQVHLCLRWWQYWLLQVLWFWFRWLSILSSLSCQSNIKLNLIFAIGMLRNVFYHLYNYNICGISLQRISGQNWVRSEFHHIRMGSDGRVVQYETDRLIWNVFIWGE